MTPGRELSWHPTDQDALAVTKAMNLPYPTVRMSPPLLKNFGIHAMPALLIIDQAGLIRDMHLGYSATLRENAAITVNKLLQEGRSTGQ